MELLFNCRLAPGCFRRPAQVGNRCPHSTGTIGRRQAASLVNHAPPASCPRTARGARYGRTAKPMTRSSYGKIHAREGPGDHRVDRAGNKIGKRIPLRPKATRCYGVFQVRHCPRGDRAEVDVVQPGEKSGDPRVSPRENAGHVCGILARFNPTFGSRLAKRQRPRHASGRASQKFCWKLTWIKCPCPSQWYDTDSPIADETPCGRFARR
jgi:hypothetical protein